MSSFWLFSFERCYRLLGDEPTNNRSIELQLINRFIKDNAHLHLLSSIPSDSIGATSILSRAVIEHVSKVSSAMHLDSLSYHLPSETDFVPGSKYTIASFSSFDMDILLNVYQMVYPSMFSDNNNFSLPQSYRKMISVTIRGQTMRVGHFIFARCVSPFPSTGSPSLRTVFSAPDVRPAKIFFHTYY